MDEQSRRFTAASASSTGQIGTGGDWLDLHFELARPEYEVQLRAVGIQPGWRVLDAACGSGSFLPWLAELVGPTGAVGALDLAPDNVSLLERRLTGWKLPCPVEAQVGTVLELPYPDATFDAIWFANTTIYLSDDELRTALTELRRVVRPGGLVAIKEIDGTLFRVLPAPPGLMLRFRLAWMETGHVFSARLLRALTLPSWLRRAGLVDVWHRTTLIERSAPLDTVVRAFYRGPLAYWGAKAAELELPGADRDVWSRLPDPDGLERFLDDPDCGLMEGNILAVGTVPARELDFTSREGHHGAAR